MNKQQTEYIQQQLRYAGYQNGAETPKKIWLKCINMQLDLYQGAGDTDDK